MSKVFRVLLVFVLFILIVFLNDYKSYVTFHVDYKTNIEIFGLEEFASEIVE